MTISGRGNFPMKPIEAFAVCLDTVRCQWRQRRLLAQIESTKPASSSGARSAYRNAFRPRQDGKRDKLDIYPSLCFSVHHLT